MKDYGRIYPQSPPGKGLILKVPLSMHGIPHPGEEILAGGVQYTVCRFYQSKDYPGELVLEIAPSGLLPQGEAIDEMLASLEELQGILSQDPEGAAILLRIQNGELSPNEALRDLIRVVKKTGQLDHLREVSTEISKKIPGYELASGSESSRPLVMVTSTGIPQLNPLYEAALIERTFLDGDVPEARTGPLPEGGQPAVPVEISSLDPVYVGLMLEKASARVAGQLTDARTSVRLLRDQAAEAGTALAQIEQELPLPTGVPGYVAQTRPELALVEPPTGEELAALTDDRRQELAHKALSSTQGRRSMAPPIQTVVLKLLQERGLTVYADAPPDENTSVKAIWSMTSWGSRDFSPRFSFGQVAARSLAENLLKQFSSTQGRVLYLEVRPYDGYSERDFGWIALLSSKRRTQS